MKNEKSLQGYQGVFFDEDVQKKLIGVQKNGLSETINNMHITFDYGEINEYPEELMEKSFTFKVIGYASDGKNSGFEVELPEELKQYYKNKKNPHITVSLGEVNGVKGKPVDTGSMKFERIENPFEIQGQLGYLVYGKGVILNNDSFEKTEEEKLLKVYDYVNQLNSMYGHMWLECSTNWQISKKTYDKLYEKEKLAKKSIEKLSCKSKKILLELLAEIEDDYYIFDTVADQINIGASSEVDKHFDKKIGEMRKIIKMELEKERNSNYTLDILELGKKIGMEFKEQTLPNGKIVKSLVWDQETLLKAVEAVKHLSGEGKPVRINGQAPAWLVSALTHTVHPCPVGLYVPQIGKDVNIPQLAHGEANPEGEVGFKVTEKGDSVLVEYEMQLPEGITTYDENNLPKVIVPEIPQGKAVYLSGRGPNYLTVAIAEAYAHTNSSVSLFQPGVGYTCSITHSRSKKLGDLVKDPLGKEEIKEQLSGAKDVKKTDKESKGLTE